MKGKDNPLYLDLDINDLTFSVGRCLFVYFFELISYRQVVKENGLGDRELVGY